MTRVIKNQHIMLTAMKIPVGTPEGARRFLAAVEPYPDVVAIKEVALKIRAAKHTLKLKNDELRPGARSLQDDVFAINGAVTHKIACAALPDEQPPSIRVCLSRLAAQGVLEKLDYGVYWNKKGERPNAREIMDAKYGPAPVERVKELSAPAMLEILRTKLPARIFKQVMEAL